MSKKLGLALGSSGSRGISHIGFLKAMEENGIKPDFLAGSSMGAVVGACYASGMTAEQLYSEAVKLKLSQFAGLSLNPIGRGGLFRSKKMIKKLNKYLNGLTFNDLKIPFTAVATDLITGESVFFNGDDNVVECVTASSSMPGIIQPLKKDGMLLVDGGVLCRVPINAVREMGAEVVVAIDALGQTRPLDKKYNVFGVLLRIFDLTDGQLTEYGKKENQPDMFLTPELGEMSQYKYKNLEFAYQKGYELGIKNAEKIKELINEK